MIIGVPEEVLEGETRVALVPESVKKLVAAGYRVLVQRGAGNAAHFADDAYAAMGAEVVPHARDVWGQADLMLKVRAPRAAGDGSSVKSLVDGEAHNEVSLARSGTSLLAGLVPTRNLVYVRALAGAGVTAYSTDAIPRTTRAQTMDTLSSMANIAGYRGAILGALLLGRYYPMLMTAAGTVPPAKVFVIGAGVAGLQAIATARRMGTHVSATDVRPEVKEQIESVGAKYVGIELAQSAAAGGGYAKELSTEDMQRQRQLLLEQCAASDVVITTALIGGVVAPRLLPADAVKSMKPGSVIIDLAADGGGNCELSQPGATVIAHGVTIAAPTNVAAAMPTHASVLWSRNLTNFVLAFTKDKLFAPSDADEIIRACTITRAGQVVHTRTKEALEHDRSRT